PLISPCLEPTTLRYALSAMATPSGVLEATLWDRHPARVRRDHPARWDRRGMVERLTDMPEGTLGFRVAGDGERKDYDDVLVPELRRAIDGGGGLRTLYLS